MDKKYVATLTFSTYGEMHRETAIQLNADNIIDVNKCNHVLGIASSITTIV